MTKQEATEYLNEVHNKVDGIKIVMLFGKFPMRVPDLDTLRSDLKGAPPMPKYDHKKYMEARKVISITGEVEEPSFKNLWETLKGFGG